MSNPKPNECTCDSDCRRLGFKSACACSKCHTGEGWENFDMGKFFMDKFFKETDEVGEIVSKAPPTSEWEVKLYEVTEDELLVDDVIAVVRETIAQARRSERESIAEKVKGLGRNVCDCREGKCDCATLYKSVMSLLSNPSEEQEIWRK